MVGYDRIGLQFFADGAAAGGSAPGAAENGNGNGLTGDFRADMRRYFGVDPGTETGAAPVRGESAGDGEKEQEAGDAGSATAGAADDNAAASGQRDTNDDEADYQAFRAKFKDRIHADFQKSFNERFKAQKSMEAELAKYKDAAGMLLDKYGLPETATIDELTQKLRDDNTTFARQAMANGVSTESYRDAWFEGQQKKKAEAQQQAQQQEAAAQQQAQERKAAIDKQLNAWQAEGEELRKLFPQFDLQTEGKNPTFSRALAGGLSVKDAYFAAHHDEILSGAVAAAAQKSAMNAAQAVARNQARPAEGGQNAGTGVQTQTNVENLTDKQIKDILKRAERGERITFS